MSGWLIYLMITLDAVNCALEAALIISVGSLVVGFILQVVARPIKDEADKECNKAGIKMAKRALPLIVIFGVLSIIAPTTKQAAAIYCLPKIINNEEVQKLPDSLLKLTNEWIEALRPPKKGK